MTYNANELHQRLIAALGVPLSIVFSGPPGSGKSTVLASVPVPAGKERIVLDFEDSMRFLDAGPEGADTYLSRFQRFRMRRQRFPEMPALLAAHKALTTKPETYGALVIDNLALMQQYIVEWILANAKTPKTIRETFAAFSLSRSLPLDSLITKWSQGADPRMWDCVKQLCAVFPLLASAKGVHFVGSTEEGNLWQNYGKPDAKVIGKKAKLFDVWYRYTDAVVFLARDVNTAGAPFGGINPHQPKLRIQGLNPKWKMDWESFVTELEAASKRREEAIPAEARVDGDTIAGEPDAVVVVKEIA